MADHPRQLNGVKLEEVVDGFLVHQPEKDKVHYLNKTAAIVLELCDGEHAPSDIASALRELFDLAEQPLAEVDDCLRTLREQGLVT